VDEGEDTSDEDENVANRSDDHGSCRGLGLVHDGNTKGNGEESGHDQIENQVDLVEIRADDEQQDEVDTEHGNDGEDLSVEILALGGRGRRDEAQQERNREFLQQDDQVEASLLVVKRAVQSSETKLEIQEEQRLTLVPDHHRIEGNGQDTKDDDREHRRSNRSTVRTASFTDVPCGRKVDGHVTNQD